jgi:hypothetical protein
MRFGMITYWKDMLSPERLRRLRNGREIHFDEIEEAEFLKLLQEQLDQGIVTVIPFEEAAYISPVFMVPKKADEKGAVKWRKVVDCRAVNAEQIDVHFRMEGPETVQAAMLPGDWMTSLDLKSAFNHLVVAPEMRPFLCFAHKGKCYSYRAMPFGAKHSPRLFIEALGYAVRYIRAIWPVRIVAYMDDLLLMHQDAAILELCTW